MDQPKHLNFEALAQALLSLARELLPQWLPGGRLQGHEYVCANLRGERGESLKVNTLTGRWADFAASEKGGDLISLYAAINGLKQGEAAKQLGDSVGHKLVSVPVLSREPTVRSVDVSPPPLNTPMPKMVHQLHGTPTNYWCYRDLNNTVLFYVARYDHGPDKKEFIPWCWSPKRRAFMPKGYSTPRPLYGLELLEGRPDAPILIVEGEKAADAARTIAGDHYVVVTWPNGSNSVEKTEWSPIFGRKVLIWPDADKAGIRACVKIAQILYTHCPQVKCIDLTESDSFTNIPGFDAADALKLGWQFQDLVTWAKPRAVVYKPNKGTEEQEIEILPPSQSESDEDTYSNQEPRRFTSVAYIKNNLPYKNSQGKPHATIENLSTMLDELGVQIRYNVISKNEELIIPETGFTIDNKANASLAWVKSWCGKVGMPTTLVGEFLTYLADQNLYNPVTTWILSKPWDGVSRLEDLYATVTAKDEATDRVVLELKKALIRRWLLSAIAAAFNPGGVSAHGVLVFQGNQYVGKTQWFKRLVPQNLAVIADGMMLKPDDKDSVKQICSFWLVELGELDATFRKSDIAQLKSFLTRDKDVLRCAYARRESEYARRTVFFASVNPKQFLHDNTGNRRFWTIECDAINHEHTINMQQLWSEVYQLYQSGETWYLTRDEMLILNGHNESFISKDAVEERLETDLDWRSEEKFWSWKTATQVLIDLGIDRPTSSEVKKTSQQLFKLNNGKRRKYQGYMQLLVPSKNYEPGQAFH